MEGSTICQRSLNYLALPGQRDLGAKWVSSGPLVEHTSLVLIVVIRSQYEYINQ